MWRLLRDGSEPEWKSELAAALRTERQAATQAAAAEGQPAVAEQTAVA